MDVCRPCNLIKKRNCCFGSFGSRGRFHTPFLSNRTPQISGLRVLLVLFDLHLVLSFGGQSVSAVGGTDDLMQI